MNSEQNWGLTNADHGVFSMIPPSLFGTLCDAEGRFPASDSSALPSNWGILGLARGELV